MSHVSRGAFVYHLPLIESREPWIIGRGVSITHVPVLTKVLQRVPTSTDTFKADWNGSVD